MNDILPNKIIRLHESFVEHAVPHAFGGAIAFGFYGEARDTRDIDINIALSTEEYQPVFDAVSTLFAIADRQITIARLAKFGQVRLFWDETPVDLFFANVPFHHFVAARVHDVDYMGHSIPIVSCEDLIVLKAVFNRSKDWFDIASMFEIQRRKLDAEYILRWISEFYASNDGPYEQIERLIEQYVHPAKSKRTH